ncbi:MAG: caspase family protein [Sedimentisphaerales bacterium]|nr:caspase family protein [Sedimentisphaerales bacterium]
MRTSSFLLAVMLFWSYTYNAPAEIQYDLVCLSKPSDFGSKARKVNDEGQVVGYFWETLTNRQAFLYENGSRIDLGILLGFPSSAAHRINNDGDIVGVWSEDGGHTERAFLYTGGTLLNLHLPGMTTSEPKAVNNRREVLVDYSYSGSFLYDISSQTNRAIDLGVYRPIDINDGGAILCNSRLGDSAAIYFGGVLTEIGTLGGTATTAHDINNKGQVVGVSAASDGSVYPFLYERGNMLRIGPSGKMGCALAINDTGQVVGYSIPDDRPFLYHNETTYDLDEAVDTSSGWVIGSLWDINNKGEIVGEANNGTHNCAILLRPISAKTHVLSVGVNWGLGLRGDIDANNLSGILYMQLPSVTDVNTLLLDPAITDGSNMRAFEDAFDKLADKANDGDTIILSFASHGESEKSGTEAPFNTNLDPHPLGYGNGPMEIREGNEYVLLSAAATDYLYDDIVRDLLQDSRLENVRKILFLDHCRSGGFGPDLTDGSISRIAVLAGCNEGYFSFSRTDGTGVFTSAVFDALREGPDGFPWADGIGGGKKDAIVTLAELAEYVEDTYAPVPLYDHPVSFGDLIGTELSLRYLNSTGVFSGLIVDFVASDDFVGGLSGRFPGDIDNDGKVDARDFRILATQWLEPPGIPSADIAPVDRDGFVDFRDLGKLFAHWLEDTRP